MRITVYAKVPESLRKNDILEAFSLGLFLIIQGESVPQIPTSDKLVSTRFVLWGSAIEWFRLLEERFRTKGELFSAVLAVVEDQPDYARICVNCE